MSVNGKPLPWKIPLKDKPHIVQCPQCDRIVAGAPLSSADHAAIFGLAPSSAPERAKPPFLAEAEANHARAYREREAATARWLEAMARKGRESGGKLRVDSTGSLLATTASENAAAKKLDKEIEDLRIAAGVALSVENAKLHELFAANRRDSIDRQREEREASAAVGIAGISARSCINEDGLPLREPR